MKLMLTIQGVMSCTVPEFKREEYKGLRSGLGKERRSSKHFGCKQQCCAKKVK